MLFRFGNGVVLVAVRGARVGVSISSRSRSTVAATQPKLVYDGGATAKPAAATAAVEETANAKDNLHQVRINTCSQLYSEWGRHWSFFNRRKPDTGLDFDVGYYDNMPDASPGTPTVVALHGSAGTHMHYSFLAPYIEPSGTRLIVPNFPGSSFTPVDPMRHFSHRDQEKACFVTDFLKAINVNRVDVMVVHSSAMFPAMRLMENPDTCKIFQSMALLNPVGHRPIKIMKPVYPYRVLITFVDIPWVRKFIYTMKPIFFRKAPTFKVSDDRMEETSKSVLFVDYKRMTELLQEMRDSRLPLLMAYNKQDRVVGNAIYSELMDMLAFKPDKIDRYNGEEKLTQQGSSMDDSRYAHGIVFETGGHFVMKAHPEVIGEAILSLLQHVIEKRSRN